MINRLIVTCRGGLNDGTIELNGTDAFFPQSQDLQTAAGFFAVDLRQKFESAASEGKLIVGKH